MSSESNNTKRLAAFLVELSKIQENGRDYEVEKWNEDHGAWLTCDRLSPYHANRTYRVKYTPRVWWMNVYPALGHMVVHATKEGADEAADTNRIECVRVVEGLD